MCYSISVKISKKEWVEIQEVYRTLTGNEFRDIIERGVKPLYFANVFKDSHPSIPVITQDRPSEVQLLRWGVIPPYAKYIESDKGLVHPWNRPNYYHTTANARIESLRDKKTWSRLYKSRRCLILASGFFEFYHAPGLKKTYPHFIHLKDRPVFAFAGLYDSWRDPISEEYVNTCAIISTRPNEMMKKIHNNPKAYDGPRCPVMLTPEEWQSWIEGDFSYEDVAKFSEPFPVESMEAFPVRQGLMSPKVDANIEGVLERMDFHELPSHWSKYGDPQSSLF